jgi:hypothetical protein
MNNLYLVVREFTHTEPFVSLYKEEDVPKGGENVKVFKWDYEALKGALKEVEFKVVEKQ